MKLRTAMKFGGVKRVVRYNNDEDAMGFDAAMGLQNALDWHEPLSQDPDNDPTVRAMKLALTAIDNAKQALTDALNYWEAADDHRAQKSMQIACGILDGGVTIEPEGE